MAPEKIDEAVEFQYQELIDTMNDSEDSDDFLKLMTMIRFAYRLWKALGYAEKARDLIVRAKEKMQTRREYSIWRQNEEAPDRTKFWIGESRTLEYLIHGAELMEESINE